MRIVPSRLSPILFATALALPLAAQDARRPMGPPPMIEASGSGEVSVLPDRAEVLVTVTVRGPTAAAAGAANARRTQRVLDTLRAARIPREQLSTIGYTVQPTYTYPGQGRPRVLEGYDARNTVRVELTDVQQVGAVIDAALAAGANDIQGVTFSLSNPTAVRRDVLAAATADARAVAEAIARAAGGSLGALLSVSTEPSAAELPDFGGRGMRAAVMAAETVPTPIYAPTAQTVSGRVIGRWLFVPGTR